MEQIFNTSFDLNLVTTIGLRLGTVALCGSLWASLNAASFCEEREGRRLGDRAGVADPIYSALAGATQASAVSAPFLPSLGGLSVAFEAPIRVHR